MIKSSKIALQSAIWDLHIHTCCCPKASNEFKGMKVEKYIDELLKIFSDYENLQMISFTDHNQISNEVYNEFYSRNTSIELIPGIEIDTLLPNSNKAKHLIIYFNLNKNNYEEFANDLNKFLNGKTPIKIEELLNFLVEKRIQFIISPHAFKQDERGINFEWNDYQIVKENAHKYMDQFFCFWEASGQSNIAQATKFLKEFDIENRISIISFSDSNNFKKLISYLDNPNQYFNCLSNFKGLQLAGTDCRRIVKKSQNIDESNLGNYIGYLNFNGENIQLSPKLNAIVGGRGSGKSLLLDASALYLKPKLDENNEMIQQSRKEYINLFKIQVKNYNDNPIESDTFEFDYFNQSYVSHIFNDKNPSKAIENYFKDEFNSVEDIDKEEILSKIKEKYKELIKKVDNGQLDNISSLTEKYSINKNSKINLAVAKKDMIKGKKIEYSNYQELLKLILENKKIIPKEISASSSIKKKIDSLIETIYEEIGKYNFEVILKNGGDYLIESYINYNSSISKQAKDKSEVEDLFLKHLRKKEYVYINRVSIINAIIYIQNNYEFYYDKFIKKNGVYNTEFIFEKSLKIEKPLDFFVRVSKKYLQNKHIDFNNINNLVDIFCFKLEEYIKDSKTVENYINEIINLDNLLIDEKNTIYYTGNGIEKENIFNMSPGTQTNILMEYIVSKETKIPLLIDQPEDNIDNETIFSKLTDWFFTLKNKRQIIVVTHDANIVINSDAENVIIANKENKDDYKYEYGALESNNTLNKISIILDGGVEAVERRLKKYGQDNTRQ